MAPDVFGIVSNPNPNRILSGNDWQRVLLAHKIYWKLKGEKKKIYKIRQISKTHLIAFIHVILSSHQLHQLLSCTFSSKSSWWGGGIIQHYCWHGCSRNRPCQIHTHRYDPQGTSITLHYMLLPHHSKDYPISNQTPKHLSSNHARSQYFRRILIIRILLRHMAGAQRLHDGWRIRTRILGRWNHRDMPTQRFLHTSRHGRSILQCDLGVLLPTHHLLQLARWEVEDCAALVPYSAHRLGIDDECHCTGSQDVW